MPTSCNFLTEGCHGGWTYLGGMFLQTYYTVTEECAPYIAEINEENGSCHEYGHCPPIAKFRDFYFVGGSYGDMTEESIMRELRANGPMNIDFLAGNDFQSYSSGVLVEQTDSTNMQASEAIISATMDWDGISDNDMESKNIEWSKVTHATGLIGWGYDSSQDMKYWLVRNSYGENWGLGGNFKIRRGQNDYACETNNVAGNPILL